MVLRPGPAITSHAHVESFEILVDKMDKMNLETPSAYTNNARTEAASPSARALGELPVENCQNSGATTANTPLPMATPAPTPTPAPTATSTSDPQSPHGVPPSGSGKPAAHLVNPEPKFIKAQIDQQALRHQRPALQPQTFEPLSAVAAKQAAGKPKPTNNTTSSARDKTVTASTRTTTSVKPDHLGNSLTAASSDLSLKHQVEKHLAGQFEWLISYPAHASKANAGASLSFESNCAPSPAGVVYGCNLVLCKPKSVSMQRSPGRQQAANSFTFLATPISGETLGPQDNSANKSNAMSWPQQAPPPYDEASLKAPDVVDMVENALSPALSGVSDERSGSFVGSSRTGSFSLPRIEDSLEELDKLEEQLEEVGALTRAENAKTPNQQTANGSPAAARSTNAAKLAALNRTNPSDKPSTRRSSSATLSQRSLQQKSEATPSRTAGPASGRQSSAASRSPTSKSSKPPTVPKFELPGEAVARRLREQREARLALQEQAQKAAIVPPKPRTITKPNFELPGEAISRRKREQQEAKLRAEEEEQRRKREFKARPIRNSVGPGIAPRENLASRARHIKSQEDEAKAKAAELARLKRTSINMGRRMSTTPATPIPAQSPQRCSQHLTASASMPKLAPSSTLTAAQKAQRRQSTLGGGLAVSKNAGNQGPDAVKSAREQAAERSRATSREWAEKKKREELAKREAQRPAGEPVASS